MTILIFFLLYQALQLIILPCIFLYILYRRFKGKETIYNWAERFGYVPRSSLDEKRKVVWLHAVSVGEVLSLQWFAHELEKKNNISVYLTVGTLSAYNLAKKNLTYSHISLLPFDFLLPLIIAFRRIRPHALVVVEAEIWPNLLMWASFLGVALYKVNARIPAASRERYRRYRFFFRPLLRLFKKIYTQSKEDVELFESIGVASERLCVGGNIKVINVLYKQPHKPEPSPTLLQAKSEPKPSIFLLGSLHQGELDYYIDVMQRLWHEGYALKLVIAPRHFHWKDDLIRKIKLLGRSYAYWGAEEIQESSSDGNVHSVIPHSSATKDILSQLLEKSDIVLVCLLGRLFDIYEYADLFFLGGTFVPIGGHNLLEPAVWAKASIVGPYYANCADIADKLERLGGLIKVKDAQSLYQETRRLLQAPEQLPAMGKKAYQWLVHESASVEKHLQELIKSF